MPQRNRI